MEITNGSLISTCRQGSVEECKQQLGVSTTVALLHSVTAHKISSWIFIAIETPNLATERLQYLFILF
jgi:hypothetical protein